MYKRIFILALLLSFYICVKAQPTLDTIKDCFKQKPRLFAEFNTRNSFISNSQAKIFGAVLGLNYGHRVHVGLGYNQLYPPAKNFDKEIYLKNNNNLNDSATASLRMFYISAYVEYIFYQTKHWELSMPLQIGIGKTSYNYEVFGQKKKQNENLNFIYEPAILVEYKFVKWLGVGADIGFRFMVTGNHRLNQKFNSPTYVFNIIIYYNEIYKAFIKLVQKH